MAAPGHPLFFGEPGYSVGRDPVLIYATALVLRFVPLSEFSVRLPTALVGVADVVLMFLLARRLFRREWLGLVAAGFVAMAPAHFMHSRLGVSLIVPLPFVLAWLLGLAAFLEDQALWRLGAATCALGLGRVQLSRVGHHDADLPRRRLSWSTRSPSRAGGPWRSSAFSFHWGRWLRGRSFIPAMPRSSSTIIRMHRNHRRCRA